MSKRGRVAGGLLVGRQTPTGPVNEYGVLSERSTDGHLIYGFSLASGLTSVDLTPGGSPAPSSAQFLVLATSTLLSQERVLSPTAPLSGTDGGAGGNYALAIAPAGQQNGDLLSRQSGAWNRLAVGSEGQRLSVVGGAPAWSWAALGSPRRIMEASARYGSATWDVIGAAPSNLGTDAWMADSDGTWMGRQTAGGAGAEAGWYWSAGFGRYDSAYILRWRIKMDADLTAESHWCGIYAIAGSRPGAGAAYTTEHVMIRFVHGTDLACQLSTCDAGGTQSTSSLGAAPVANTAYFAELDFRTPGQVTARVYDGRGTALGNSVTKATNLPSAATIMGRSLTCVSQGAGMHTMYASKIHLEAY